MDTHWRWSPKRAARPQGKSHRHVAAIPFCGPVASRHRSVSPCRGSGKECVRGGAAICPSEASAQPHQVSQVFRFVGFDFVDAGERDPMNTLPSIIASRTGPRRESASAIHSKESPLIVPSETDAASKALVRKPAAVSNSPFAAKLLAWTIRPSHSIGSPKITGVACPLAKTSLRSISQAMMGRKI